MRILPVSVLLAFSVAAVGCGGDDPRSSDDDGTSGIGTATNGSSDSASESNGEGNSESTTTGPTTDTGPTTTGDGDGDGDDDDDSGGSGTVFDLGGLPDAGINCGAGGGNDPEFTFLWAANSSQGTISKIDTNTVMEVGRYQVRPDGQGSPSRTSVSLTGHVAVASRQGGVTKFYATEEFCEESNGMPGIQTSLNNQALPWDQEECRAWHTPFDYNSQRPLAWAPGTWNAGTCEWDNEMLWTAGRYGSNQDQVLLLDGDTGVVVETVDIPGLKSDSFGIYGAAVDSEGNFWGTGWATGNHLVRVDRQTMEATVWDGPSSTGFTSHWYGMTVDVNGYVWNCASRVARFDPMTEEWAVSDELGAWSAGCMADADPDGLLWLGGTGVRGLNRETFEVVYNWPTPSSYGVSIDFNGYVWAVNGNGAHRVDPMTGQVTSYNGLVGAYTYSDMTGAALSAVGGNPNG
ncbi:hypothetical protein [Enhygromyxa salina]|nr:hypothetical protein [Enhygromyxa salina]